jgi:hypothetical protein
MKKLNFLIKGKLKKPREEELELESIGNQFDEKKNPF